MQPYCFGRENKEKDQHCIVGYLTIWEHNSKHIRVDNSQYKMQNYLEHHKTTIENWFFCSMITRSNYYYYYYYS